MSLFIYFKGKGFSTRIIFSLTHIVLEKAVRPSDFAVNTDSG